MRLRLRKRTITEADLLKLLSISSVISCFRGGYYHVRVIVDRLNRNGSFDKLVIWGEPSDSLEEAKASAFRKAVSKCS